MHEERREGRKEREREREREIKGGIARKEFGRNGSRIREKRRILRANVSKVCACTLYISIVICFQSNYTHTYIYVCIYKIVRE